MEGDDSTSHRSEDRPSKALDRNKARRTTNRDTTNLRRRSDYSDGSKDEKDESRDRPYRQRESDRRHHGRHREEHGRSSRRDEAKSRERSKHKKRKSRGDEHDADEDLSSHDEKDERKRQDRKHHHRRRRRRDDDSDDSSQDQKSRKHRKKHRRKNEEEEKDKRSNKKDKKREKSKKTSKKDNRDLISLGKPLGKPPATPLDPERDYFAYHEHLWVYLYREKNQAFNDMTADETRIAFASFVQRYNKGDLEQGYYVKKLPAAVLDECKTTNHKWSFRISESEGDHLHSIEAGVRNQTEYKDPGIPQDMSTLPVAPADSVVHDTKLGSRNATDRLDERGFKEHFPNSQGEISRGRKGDPEQALEKPREVAASVPTASRDREAASGRTEKCEYVLYGMDETISLNESHRQWNLLLNLKQQSDELVGPSAVLPGNDPFDCSDCSVPTTYALVEEAVEQAIYLWKDLDDRRIPEGEIGGEDLGDNNPQKKKPKWFEKHVRLPQNFDYATRNDPPVDTGGGDRVVQLDDPTQTSSYEQELWHLFKSVKGCSELEKAALNGLSSPTMEEVREQWENLKNPLLGDEYGAVRLRANDRHGAPEEEYSPPTEDCKGSLVFEVWRGMMTQLKRNSSPSNDRTVIEFLGGQTLADFHRVLVEIADDSFWDKSVQQGSSSTGICSTTNERSGIFLIEDTMYKIGPVDYSLPILDWFNEDNKRIKHNLGITSSELKVQPMEGVLLQEIPMRLGIRYLHMHSGTLASQVFLIDRRHGSPRQPKLVDKYPIFHDLWSHGVPSPDCEACTRRVSAVVTSMECDLTDGLRFLCNPCAHLLQVPDGQKQQYFVWKSFGQSSGKL